MRPSEPPVLVLFLLSSRHGGGAETRRRQEPEAKGPDVATLPGATLEAPVPQVQAPRAAGSEQRE